VLSRSDTGSLHRQRHHNRHMMSQPPWTHSTSLGGEFYYNPRTDEIVMRNGQHFARPRQMPADAFRASSFDDGSLPFQYTGSPPGPSNSFPLAGGRQQVLPNRQGPPGPLIRPPGAINPSKPAQLRSTQQIPVDRELQVVFNARTGSQIARREPVRNHAPDRNVPGISIGNESATSTLFPDFRIKPAAFFSLGRVFLVLWSEPAGGGSMVTKWESIRRFGASSWFDQAKAVPLSAQLCPSTRMAGKALRSLESTNRSTASSIQLELRRLRDRTSYQDEGMKMACSKYPFGLTQTLRLRLSMRCLG
jgi:hypothetical protein